MMTNRNTHVYEFVKGCVNLAFFDEKRDPEGFWKEFRKGIENAASRKEPGRNLEGDCGRKK